MPSVMQIRYLKSRDGYRKGFLSTERRLNAHGRAPKPPDRLTKRQPSVNGSRCRNTETVKAPSSRTDFAKSVRQFGTRFACDIRVGRHKWHANLNSEWADLPSTSDRTDRKERNAYRNSAVHSDRRGAGRRLLVRLRHREIQPHRALNRTDQNAIGMPECVTGSSLPSSLSVMRKVDVLK